jgi:predicted HicB family RNase H-like nuclease
MDLTPYLDGLRRDLAASAAAGGAEVSRAAELLAGSLDASARLCLMEALADAAAEVTTRLGTASVEVRLRGREAELVVTEIVHPEPELAPTAPAAPAEGSGDVARITLRLPEGLKESVERVAAAEGISVNAWLVRAVAAAVSGRPMPPMPPMPPTPPFPPGRASLGKRITGFAQA